MGSARGPPANELGPGPADLVKHSVVPEEITMKKVLAFTAAVALIVPATATAARIRPYGTKPAGMRGHVDPYPPRPRVHPYPPRPRVQPYPPRHRVQPYGSRPRVQPYGSRHRVLRRGR
jgi:hypothetical protein